jgi:hypothetical protein
LTVDGTTTFDLALSTVYEGVYRLTVTGGTAAGFRTARAVDLTGEAVTVAVNNNATATFALAAASVPDFSAVQVGDVVFIPDATTGDSTSPFNVLNVGFWAVLAIGPSGVGANRKLTCRRLPGQSFQGAGETQTVTAAGEFIVFSPGPVQAGDTLAISDGFSVVSQQTFIITAVTDSWIEFSSSESLPLETDIVPGAAGINIYSESKSFVRVEVDQPCYLQLNGSTGQEIELTPRRNGDSDQRAHFEMWGNIWQLAVVNRSAYASVTVQLISAAEAT